MPYSQPLLGYMLSSWLLPHTCSVHSTLGMSLLALEAKALRQNRISGEYSGKLFVSLGLKLSSCANRCGKVW